MKNAEQYYRTMFRGRVSSWNLRDTHMAETLDALVEHFALRRADGKVVVWAHNSHLGDARATQMGRAGEWNVGQLVRQKHGRRLRSDRIHHLRRHRDGGLELGRPGGAQDASVRPWREAMNRYSTPRDTGVPADVARRAHTSPAGFASPCWSVPSA